MDGEETIVSFKPPRPGTEPRTLAWKAAVLTTTLGPPPIHLVLHIHPKDGNVHLRGGNVHGNTAVSDRELPALHTPPDEINTHSEQIDIAIIGIHGMFFYQHVNNGVMMYQCLHTLIHHYAVVFFGVWWDDIRCWHMTSVNLCGEPVGCRWRNICLASSSILCVRNVMDHHWHVIINCSLLPCRKIWHHVYCKPGDKWRVCLCQTLPKPNPIYLLMWKLIHQLLSCMSILSNHESDTRA